MTVTGGRITFPVSDVTPARTPLPEVSYHEAVADFLGGSVEACSRYHGRLVADIRCHPLLGALNAAFASHRPVCLSPDIIWLTLTQGLAQHVNAHAEDLRRHFVRYEGKVKIAVRRDDFIKGSPENPWPEVFREFSEAIRGHIGDEAHALVVADFSTTGLVERAASEVVLLDAMQSYFEYDFLTICGIPSVTLEGTVEDWRSLARRAEGFARLGMGRWVERLRPLLAQLVAAAGGDVDRGFWESMYTWGGPKRCGEPHVSGWVVDFFPYLCCSGSPPLCRNPWMGRSLGQRGPQLNEFPALPSKAPFGWQCPDQAYEMELIGGLIGVRQNPETLCLKPEVGWAVRQAGSAGCLPFRRL